MTQLGPHHGIVGPFVLHEPRDPQAHMFGSWPWSKSSKGIHLGSTQVLPQDSNIQLKLKRLQDVRVMQDRRHFGGEHQAAAPNIYNGGRLDSLADEVPVPFCELMMRMREFIEVPESFSHFFTLQSGAKCSFESSQQGLTHTSLVFPHSLLAQEVLQGKVEFFLQNFKYNFSQTFLAPEMWLTGLLSNTSQQIFRCLNAPSIANLFTMQPSEMLLLDIVSDSSHLVRKCQT
ncbi:hypothetical protein E2C01_056352 [Portunus trituberculatus]|uniref:Uncharacterized protein n=1 Tax=Portunus trituberculatus TaxID=210409 RepID=A0A5B7GXI1_PORTR|nr:hypothetical protein [Portunus trituberculatus]